MLFSFISPKYNECLSIEIIDKKNKCDNFVSLCFGQLFQPI